MQVIDILMRAKQTGCEVELYINSNLLMRGKADLFIEHMTVNVFKKETRAHWDWTNGKVKMFIKK